MTARVSKFTISMPEDLLAGLDAEAEALGMTRSGVIREASVVYLQQRRETDAATVRRRRVQDAVAIMKGIASQPSADTRSSLEILREVRDHDGLGEPPPHPARGGE